MTFLLEGLIPSDERHLCSVSADFHVDPDSILDPLEEDDVVNQAQQQQERWGCSLNNLAVEIEI